MKIEWSGIEEMYLVQPSVSPNKSNLWRLVHNVDLNSDLVQLTMKKVLFLRVFCKFSFVLRSQNMIW
mgnify:CR=1 FL=1